MFDTHLHSHFSADSNTDPLLIINSAKENLSGIIFTEHCDIDYKSEPKLFDIDIPKYISALSAIRDKHSSPDFYIGIGLELGLQLHLKEDLIAIADQKFDFILGSVHTVDGIDPYYEDFFFGYDINDRYREYFQYVLSNIKTHDCFDSLAHLDYISRYGEEYSMKNGLEIVEPCEETMEEILDTLINKQKALEVNTSPFSRGKNEPNPSFFLLEKYYKMGGRMITIGSDSHNEKNVGINFKEVALRLKEIGFKSQLVYKNRVPQEYGI